MVMIIAPVDAREQVRLRGLEGLRKPSVKRPGVCRAHAT
jgi:hypothetical protein